MLHPATLQVATQLASLGMLGSRSKSAFGSASSGSNLMQQRSSSGAWAAQQTMAMSSGKLWLLYNRSFSNS